MRCTSILLLLVVLFAVRSVLANETPFEPGDAAFKERSDSAQALKALETYRDLYRHQPRDPEAGWRVAMACYFVGLRLTTVPEERENLFREGIHAGRESVFESPSCAGCHFWTAINMALYAQERGAMTFLSSLSEIREHLNMVLKLDPSYAFSGARRLLGLIDQKLPGILGGSNQRAQRYFTEALQMSPEEPMNYLFYAKFLYQEFGRTKTALDVAKKGTLVIVSQADRLESREAHEELQSLIGQIEGDQRWKR